jgi:hypothetical protein
MVHGVKASLSIRFCLRRSSSVRYYNMAKYQQIDVSEQLLEDLVRQNADLIEEGLVYVHHQRITGSGRLDVLLVDSGRSLVLAELKVVEDDGMLLQGLDYYDYVSSHVEAIARLYGKFSIDPTQSVRLFLIGPSFSQSLITRCKGIDVPISLFTYMCIKLEGSDEILPVFSEQTIPSPPDVLETHSLDDRLNYITDVEVRLIVKRLLEEIGAWDTSGKISVEAIKYSIALKVSGRNFAYISPRRKFFLIETFNQDGKWVGYPIHSDEDLTAALELVRASFTRYRK